MSYLGGVRVDVLLLLALSPYIHFYIYLSIYLYLSIHLSIYLSIYIYTHGQRGGGGGAHEHEDEPRQHPDAEHHDQVRVWIEEVRV